jgi:hypothetical protein
LHKNWLFASNYQVVTKLSHVKGFRAGSYSLYVIKSISLF